MPRTVTQEQVAEFWRARANRLRWALVDIATRAGGDPEERASRALEYEREHDGGPDPVETARAELQGARDALDAAIVAGQQLADEHAAFVGQAEAEVARRGALLTAHRASAWDALWSAVGLCMLNDGTIESYRRITRALPCPKHGPDCVPHVLDEIARLRGLLAEQVARLCAQCGPCPNPCGDGERPETHIGTEGWQTVIVPAPTPPARTEDGGRCDGEDEAGRPCGGCHIHMPPPEPEAARGDMTHGFACPRLDSKPSPCGVCDHNEARAKKRKDDAQRALVEAARAVLPLLFETVPGGGGAVYCGDINCGEMGPRVENVNHRDGCRVAKFIAAVEGLS